MGLQNALSATNILKGSFLFYYSGEESFAVGRSERPCCATSREAKAACPTSQEGEEERQTVLRTSLSPHRWEESPELRLDVTPNFMYEKHNPQTTCLLYWRSETLWERMGLERPRGLMNSQVAAEIPQGLLGCKSPLSPSILLYKVGPFACFHAARGHCQIPMPQ